MSRYSVMTNTILPLFPINDFFHNSYLHQDEIKYKIKNYKIYNNYFIDSKLNINMENFTKIDII